MTNSDPPNGDTIQVVRKRCSCRFCLSSQWTCSNVSPSHPVYSPQFLHRETLESRQNHVYGMQVDLLNPESVNDKFRPKRGHKWFRKKWLWSILWFQRTYSYVSPSHPVYPPHFLHRKTLKPRQNYVCSSKSKS